ncbi:hypothetical protein CYLTODRAFT_447519 [Cylindrobasidium torrendii FP15055 ss-10]|uniref:Ams2/SPT21 N-terminal domain-containing protein n=1 Tax=Cylindrobasidium torrendii FP15055 ss-10 TaxID=1314674 RepID=A0A0D7AVF0_9AGAR|nr:hypothetical protein CYLTODRAFT_447519 [Cylindrobasidium torrendii FP15055 ss-10]
MERRILRISYSIDGNTQSVLARPTAVDVNLIAPPTNCHDHRRFGTVSLRRCLSILAQSSPEVFHEVCGPGTTDYTIYHLDLLEAINGNKRTEGEEQPHRGVPVAMGLMSWGLQEPEEDSASLAGELRKTPDGRSGVDIFLDLRKTARIPMVGQVQNISATPAISTPSAHSLPAPASTSCLPASQQPNAALISMPPPMAPPLQASAPTVETAQVIAEAMRRQQREEEQTAKARKAAERKPVVQETLTAAEILYNSCGYSTSKRRTTSIKPTPATRTTRPVLPARATSLPAGHPELTSAFVTPADVVSPQPLQPSTLRLPRASSSGQVHSSSSSEGPSYAPVSYLRGPLRPPPPPPPGPSAHPLIPLEEDPTSKWFEQAIFSNPNPEAAVLHMLSQIDTGSAGSNGTLVGYLNNILMKVRNPPSTPTPPSSGSLDSSNKPVPDKENMNPVILPKIPASEKTPTRNSTPSPQRSGLGPIRNTPGITPATPTRNTNTRKRTFSQIEDDENDLRGPLTSPIRPRRSTTTDSAGSRVRPILIPDSPSTPRVAASSPVKPKSAWRVPSWAKTDTLTKPRLSEKAKLAMELEKTKTREEKARVAREKKNANSRRRWQRSRGDMENALSRTQLDETEDDEDDLPRSSTPTRAGPRTPLPIVSMSSPVRPANPSTAASGSASNIFGSPKKRPPTTPPRTPKQRRAHSTPPSSLFTPLGWGSPVSHQESPIRKARLSQELRTPSPTKRGDSSTMLPIASDDDDELEEEREKKPEREFWEGLPPSSPIPTSSPLPTTDDLEPDEEEADGGDGRSAGETPQSEAEESQSQLASQTLSESEEQLAPNEEEDEFLKMLDFTNPDALSQFEASDGYDFLSSDGEPYGTGSQSEGELDIGTNFWDMCGIDAPGGNGQVVEGVDFGDAGALAAHVQNLLSGCVM